MARIVARATSIGSVMICLPLLALLLNPGSTMAQNGNGVSFNQGYIEQALSAPDFAIDDISAAFAHVFAALAPRVKVYPTENYYYFSFGHGGVIYAGNMRLDIKDRDAGVLHFAYFNQNEDWNTTFATHYKALDGTDGVTVEKTGALAYKVTFAGKSVDFILNDLSAVTPPEDALGPGEEYLGPVFDESGVQFYFLLNRTQKLFLFVLNEAGTAADELRPYSEQDPDIVLGMRTGFAYARDRFMNRRVLIGVYGGNVDINNYFDGPFDQLPDNFFKPGQFLDAVLAVYPDLKDRLDSFGSFKDQDGRVLIAPYVNYRYLNELEEFRRCRNPGMPRNAYYRCLLPADEMNSSKP